MRDSLLIEVLTEELPPKSLKRLGDDFGQRLFAILEQFKFTMTDSSWCAFAAPRRLAVRVSNIASQAPDEEHTQRGPYVATALDQQGNPTAALQGFARKWQTSLEQLTRERDTKGEYFVYRFMSKGGALLVNLDSKVAEALQQLPIAKKMRWGDRSDEFVRPVRGMLMVYGGAAVGGQVMGRECANTTFGHRFMSKGAIKIAHADYYESTLRKSGKVIASFEERKKKIVKLIKKEEARNQAYIVTLGKNLLLGDTLQQVRAKTEILKAQEALVDEVTALVEFPVAYIGHFADELLQLPMECLTLSMRQQQKYFPMFDHEGKLLSKFLFISNVQVKDAENIIHGNERVLMARLADAKFFLHLDRKTKLHERVAKLADVVYHGKLGSQLERVQRLKKSAGAIAAKMGLDVESAERAAYLCKADLLTEMVGEFPELQGTIGRYYALCDGEAESVANAVEEHYLPKSAADDSLPHGIGAALGLSDRLESIVGLIGIGLLPSGDKDPYSLRRHAVAVIRILLDQGGDLDLIALLKIAQAQFSIEVISNAAVVDAYKFILERLRHYLREQKYEANEIEAVVTQLHGKISQAIPKLKAVQAFKQLPDAVALAAANKRISNILNKNSHSPSRAHPDPALMQDGAEKDLYRAIVSLAPEIELRIEQRDYQAALCKLSTFRVEVDRFFDEVMVMVDDAVIRQNRQALLQQLATLMNQVADISKLAA